MFPIGYGYGFGLPKNYPPMPGNGGAGGDGGGGGGAPDPSTALPGSVLPLLAIATSERSIRLAFGLAQYADYHEYEYSLQDADNWSEFAVCISGVDVLNLTAGTFYDFRVRGVNENGPGAWSYVTASTQGLPDTSDPSNPDPGGSWPVDDGTVLPGTTVEDPAVGSTSSASADITLPADIRAGDLIVICDMATDESTPAPDKVIPAGFTELYDGTSGAAAARIVWSAKVADGTEGGTTVTGMAGDKGIDGKVARVFRMSSGVITGFGSAASGLFTYASGNPAPLVVTSSNGVGPFIAMGALYEFLAGNAISPRNWTVDGEASAAQNAWMGWKIYSEGNGADFSVDMDDEGIQAMSGLYLPLTVSETTSAVVVDSSQGGHDLVLVNADSTNVVDGHAGKALDLNGTNEYGYADGVDQASGSITMGAWVNSDGGSNQRTIIGKWFKSPSWGYLLFTNSGQVSFMYRRTGGSSDRTWYTGYTLPTSEDHHVAIRADTTTGRAELYIDGRLEAWTILDDSGGLQESGAPLGVGALYNDGSWIWYWDGRIEKPFFYDGVMTAKQIADRALRSGPTYDLVNFANSNTISSAPSFTLKARETGKLVAFIKCVLKMNHSGRVGTLGSVTLDGVAGTVVHANPIIRSYETILAAMVSWDVTGSQDDRTLVVNLGGDAAESSQFNRAESFVLTNLGSPLDQADCGSAIVTYPQTATLDLGDNGLAMYMVSKNAYGGYTLFTNAKLVDSQAISESYVDTQWGMLFTDDSPTDPHDEDLEPGATSGYWLAGSWGGSTAPVDTAKTTAPGAVDDLVAMAYGDNAAILTWSGILGADYYEVRWSPAGAGTWSDPLVLASGGIVTGVTAGATDFEVRAVNSVGSSDWSNTSTVTVTVSAEGGSAPTAAPAWIAGNTGGNTALCIGWADVAGANSYEVRYAPHGTTSFTTVAIEHFPVNQWWVPNLFGLTEDQLYDIQVRGKNSHGSGPWSDTVSLAPSGTVFY